MLLTERYRPGCRADISGNTETINRIFSMVDSGKLTHLCFEGVAGVGKTSTAYVIAHQLFGANLKSNFIEMNASDERGIDVVREKITNFARMSPFNSSFKIILLDEADSMTSEAQNALRRTMEKYSDITIFIFACNSKEKLIDPILSRCEVFHFGPLSVEDILARLTTVASKEGLIKTVPDANLSNALLKIAEYSQGDMRKALNHLQVLLASGEPLTEASVDCIKPVDYGKLVFDALQAGKFMAARTHVFKALELGYDARSLLSLLHKVYISEETLELDEMKNSILALSECDYRMTQGVDKILALDALMLRLLKR